MPEDLKLSKEQQRIVSMYALQWLIDNYLDDEDELNHLLDQYWILMNND